MECSIKCSFGEVIDKLTILKIKLSKVIDVQKKDNILKEYNYLKPYMKDDDETILKLFDNLYKINNELWNLEDEIREYYKTKTYDEKFINCANNIHIKNDIRFSIKNHINQLYNSEIKEEKLYIEDVNEEFKNAMNYWNNGNIIESNSILQKLCSMYNEQNIYNDFIINLYFSYINTTTILNVNYEFHDKLKYIMDNIYNLTSNKNLISFCKEIYCLTLLKMNKYDNLYLKNLMSVNNLRYNICPETMSFFNEYDVNKILLIYSSGGLGDMIMFSRFIPIVCNKYTNNTVQMIIDYKLYWIFSKVFGKISNLKIIVYNDHIDKFDYHCNLIMLMYYLGITYDNIPVNYYLKDLVLEKKKIFDNTKRNVCINWGGSKKNNIIEKYNRSIPLQLLIPIFKKYTDINWISIKKDISHDETVILENYNVKNLGPIIDNNGNSFEDTIHIFKETELVITTDTSIAHVAGTLDTNCIVLLTIGNEWRWGNNNTTNWYPKMTLLRQEKYNDWSNVIENLIEKLKI